MKCACPRRRRDLRRYIADRLIPIFGPGTTEVRKPSDPPDAPDVIAPHVVVSCATARKVDARAVLRDAMGRTRYADEWVVAACKDDGQPPIVAMRLDQFLSLLTEWQVGRVRPKAPAR